MNWELITNFSLAILAILNPIGLIPIWSELAGDEQKNIQTKIALLVTLTSGFILIIFLIFGRQVLELFHIDLASFQMAGGIFLLLTGIHMLEGKTARLKDRKEDGDSSSEIAKKRFKKIIVPLGIPMLAGPGSITTVLIYGIKAEKVSDYAGLSVVLLAAILILFLFFYSSSWLDKKIDKLVFVVITRIFGLIIAAIAISFIFEALKKAFPSLG